MSEHDEFEIGDLVKHKEHSARGTGEVKMIGPASFGVLWYLTSKIIWYCRYTLLLEKVSPMRAPKFKIGDPVRYIDEATPRTAVIRERRHSDEGWIYGVDFDDGGGGSVGLSWLERAFELNTTEEIDNAPLVKGDPVTHLDHPDWRGRVDVPESDQGNVVVCWNHARGFNSYHREHLKRIPEEPELEPELDTEYTNEPICPWCGAVYVIDDDYSLYEESSSDVDCPECDRPFSSRCSTSRSFSTERRDLIAEKAKKERAKQKNEKRRLERLAACEAFTPGTRVRIKEDAACVFKGRVGEVANEELDKMCPKVIVLLDPEKEDRKSRRTFVNAGTLERLDE